MLAKTGLAEGSGGAAAGDAEVTVTGAAGSGIDFVPTTEVALDAAWATVVNTSKFAITKRFFFIQ
jgi:hypothetical protein